MKWHNENYPKGIRKFAWFPTTLQGGKTVWLEYYFQRYRVVECGCSIDATGWIQRVELGQQNEVED